MCFRYYCGCSCRKKEEDDFDDAEGGEIVDESELKQDTAITLSGLTLEQYTKRQNFKETLAKRGKVLADL